MDLTPVAKLGELDVDGVRVSVCLKKGSDVFRGIVGNWGRGESDVDVQRLASPSRP